jgi:hypothetical protein
MYEMLNSIHLPHRTNKAKNLKSPCMRRMEMESNCRSSSLPKIIRAQKKLPTRLHGPINETLLRQLLCSFLQNCMIARNVLNILVFFLLNRESFRTIYLPTFKCNLPRFTCCYCNDETQTRHIKYGKDQARILRL